MIGKLFENLTQPTNEDEILMQQIKGTDRYFAFADKATRFYFFAAGFISCALINLAFIVIRWMMQ